MGRPSVHITEEELILTAMGELPPGRSAAVQRHLEACGMCRASLDEIEKLVADYVEARRPSLDALLPPAGLSRAALRRKLAAAAAPASWLGRIAAGAPRVRAALLLASIATVVAVFAIARLERPADRIDARFVPDPTLTPGLVGPASSSELCASGGAQVPSVRRSLALEVFRLHGVAAPRPRAYELDFLIPPELGGTNDIRNLWPQPYDANPWSAHAKDALEDHLLDLVCGGEIELATAQGALAHDWTASYRRYFRVEEPLVEHASFLKDQPWE